MKVIWMNGGLGNQLFQYIFYRFVEIVSGDDCYIDDRFFTTTKAHNGYEIERIFGLKPKLLKERFSPKEWEEIVEESKNRVNIIPCLASRGLKLLPFSEGNFFAERYSKHTVQYKGPVYSIPANQYVPDTGTIEGDVYFHGYWINAHWFQYIRDEIMDELVFPSALPHDTYTQHMIERIDGSHSIGVHVRRGDFVTLGWAMDFSWYATRIPAMRKFIRNPVFFLFSDDLIWCKENFASLGFLPSDEVVFIDGNTGANSYRDLQLLSHCQNMIIANSSFSYLAALLNQRPNKYILNPSEAREIL